MHISPDDFWKTTVAEWRWLSEPEGAAMTRGEFDELSAAFPDASNRAPFGPSGHFPRERGKKEFAPRFSSPARGGGVGEADGGGAALAMHEGSYK